MTKPKKQFDDPRDDTSLFFCIVEEISNDDRPAVVVLKDHRESGPAVEVYERWPAWLDADAAPEGVLTVVVCSIPEAGVQRWEMRDAGDWRRPS